MIYSCLNDMLSTESNIEIYWQFDLYVKVCSESYLKKCFHIDTSVLKINLIKYFRGEHFSCYNSLCI
jgi:hypothetical protein